VQQETNLGNKKSFKYLKPGDSAPLSFFETGDFVHAVESFPGQGCIYGRSAGSFCQIISSTKSIPLIIDSLEPSTYAIVRLPSKKKRQIDIASYATIGVVSIINKNKPNLMKAGRVR